MRVSLTILLLTAAVACRKTDSGEPVRKDGILYTNMVAEALPPMHCPRASFALQEVDGDLLVVGGHTTGFLTTATAEYYHRGRWREVPTLYPHDGAFSLRLQDGSVVVGGGYESSFGIGQTWGVEKFDPGTASFTHLPIMDNKRAHSSALELPGGTLVISGNWYAPDAVERLSPGKEAVHWDDVTEERSYPYILPVGPERIWIFGGNCGSRMQPLQGIVDVPEGASFSPELFREWMTVSAYERNVAAGEYVIGPWTYLIPAIDREGQFAPMIVSPEGFSLMEMETPIPMEGPWGPIHYKGTFWVDQAARTAWIAGQDDAGHAFLAAVGYGLGLDGGKASLKMYYSHPLDQLAATSAELRLSDGRFALVGGCTISNYEPSDTAYMLYPLGRARKGIPWWLFAALAVLMAVAVPFVKSGKTAAGRMHEVPETPESSEALADKGIRNRLIALMEDRQLYRKKGLKITDVATELGTNTTYVSACLSGQMGTSFRHFIMEYRIEYARRLMKANPEMRLSQVADEAGFSNEKTFLRTFKACTGQTPTEWKKSS